MCELNLEYTSFSSTLTPCLESTTSIQDNDYQETDPISWANTTSTDNHTMSYDELENFENDPEIVTISTESLPR